MLNPYDHGNHPIDMAPKKVSSLKGVRVEDFEETQGGLSSRGLRLALWYEKRRLLLYKIAVGALSIVGLGLWVYSIAGWAGYLAYGLDETRRLEQQLTHVVDYTGFHARFASVPLLVESTGVLPGGVNKFDAVAVVKNPNERFAAVFAYYFDFGDGRRVSSTRTFLLPGEKRPLVYFGLESAESLPELAIEEMLWQRISRHKVDDVKIWQDERLNFSVSDFQFRRAGASDAPHADMITFKLRNNSPFGYVNPEFYVGLFQSQSLIAIKRLQVASIKSQETADVDLRNFVPDLNVTDVAVYPLINVYNPKVYVEQPK